MTDQPVQDDDFPNEGVTWLYYGDLAPDDFMWSLQMGIRQCVNLFDRPGYWVAHVKPPSECEPPQLADRHADAPGRRRLRLVSPFTMQVTLAKGELKDRLGERVQIDGIDETGILRLVVSELSALPLAKDSEEVLDTADEALPCTTDDYWDCLCETIKSHPPQPGSSWFHVIDDVENGRWFGHLQVYDRSWFPHLRGRRERRFRAAWIAQYLLMRIIDPKGYVERLLARLSPVINDVGSEAQGGKPTFADSSDMSFAYAGTEDSNEVVCDVVNGYKEGQTYYAQDATVKNYKAESG